MQAAFSIVVQGQESAVTSFYGSISNSFERLALLSLKYTGVLGGRLRAAINSDNRAEAWYEIRYASNADGDHASRRYEEAALFGLYDADGLSTEEAMKMLQMLQLHRTRIESYERDYGSAIAQANADLIALAAVGAGFDEIRVQALALEFENARALVTADLAARHQLPASLLNTIAATNIYLDPGRDSTTQSLNPNHPSTLNSTRRDAQGNEIASDDLLIGEGGRDTLTAGAGSDLLIGGTGPNMRVGGAILIRFGFLGAVAATSACAQNSVTASSSGMDINYIYQASVDQNTELCAHMGRVFNTRFQKIWEREALLLGDDNSPYSATGKYVFPKLSGVEHDNLMAAEMVASKVPSSPEFDAIGWKEGRLTTGSPPGVTITSSTRSHQMLVSYIDFDNDGQRDTVVKNGFTEGYGLMRYGHTHAERLTVKRGEIARLTPNFSLWDFQNTEPADERPLTVNGSYLRPFIYKGHTYVADYEMEFGDVEGRVGPYPLLAETMTILDFRDTGKRSTNTQMPMWDSTVVCQYQMKQVNQ